MKEFLLIWCQYFEFACLKKNKKKIRNRDNYWCIYHKPRDESDVYPSLDGKARFKLRKKDEKQTKI